MTDHSARPRSSEPSFGALVLRGASWTLISQVVVQAGRFGFVLVLARLLTPDDFGLVAMALVVTGFVIAFSDLGLGAALVQRQVIDERARSTVFWAGIAAGTALTLAGVAVSPLLAHFYGDPRVQGLMAALSVSFLVTALGATQRALLTREMNFRNVELATMVGVYVGGVAGVTGALVGWGAWSLVVQQLTNTTVTSFALALLSPWRPHATFSVEVLRNLGGYGTNVLGTRLTYYGQESALPLIIGRSLGASALGVFTVAYNIVLIPLRRLAVPIGQVLFPAFARLQHEPERMAHYWLRALAVLAAFTVPAMLALAVVAPDVVPILLGDQWEDAVPVLQILAWVGLLQTLAAWHGSILMALGRADALFRATLLFFATYVVAFLIGTRWGIIGTAVAYAVVEPLVEAAYLWLTTRALGIRFFRPLRALVGVAQAALGMLIAMVATRAALVEAGSSPGLRVPIVLGLGVVVYAVLFKWRAADVLDEVQRLRRERSREAAASGAG